MSYVRDILGLAGGALVIFGLWQWYIPLAYVAGGCLMLAGAVWWSATARN